MITFANSISYWRTKKIDYAVEDMMRALHIAELDSSAFTTVEDLHLADVYFDLGLLHSEINELEKAAGYYNKAQPLLERLSINSSKRRADYQRLETLIMCNNSRIRNAIFDKEWDDSSVSNSSDLYQEQEPNSEASSEEFIVPSQDEIYKEKFNWIGEIIGVIVSTYFIIMFYSFVVGLLVIFALGAIDQGQIYIGWFIGIVGALGVFHFIVVLFKHLNTSIREIRNRYVSHLSQ